MFETTYYVKVNCLSNEKKSAQKVWSKDLMYEESFRLSRRIPHAFTVPYDLNFFFYNLHSETLRNKTINKMKEIKIKQKLIK